MTPLHTNEIRRRAQQSTNHSRARRAQRKTDWVGWGILITAFILLCLFWLTVIFIGITWLG